MACQIYFWRKTSQFVALDKVAEWIHVAPLSGNSLYQRWSDSKR